MRVTTRSGSSGHSGRPGAGYGGGGMRRSCGVFNITPYAGRSMQEWGSSPGPCKKVAESGLKRNYYVVVGFFFLNTTTLFSDIIFPFQNLYIYTEMDRI